MRKNLAEKLHDEMYEASYMLQKQGKSYAECRHLEIMATLLLLIYNSLQVCRSLLSVLIGLLIGRGLSALIFGG